MVTFVLLNFSRPCKPSLFFQHRLKATSIIKIPLSRELRALGITIGKTTSTLSHPSTRTSTRKSTHTSTHTFIHTSTHTSTHTQTSRKMSKKIKISKSDKFDDTDIACYHYGLGFQRRGVHESRSNPCGYPNSSCWNLA